jgi:hypothetical protein
MVFLFWWVTQSSEAVKNEKRLFCPVLTDVQSSIVLFEGSLVLPVDDGGRRFIRNVGTFVPLLFQRQKVRLERNTCLSFYKQQAIHSSTEHRKRILELLILRKGLTGYYLLQLSNMQRHNIRHLALTPVLNLLESSF